LNITFFLNIIVFIHISGECSKLLRYRSFFSILTIGLTLVASVFTLFTLIHIPQIYAISSTTNGAIDMNTSSTTKLLLYRNEIANIDLSDIGFNETTTDANASGGGPPPFNPTYRIACGPGCQALVDRIIGMLIDRDGDGIPTTWETNGIDINKDGKVDLILPDANPLHKDLYVEVDHMISHKPNDKALDDVISHFAAAPVSNPDGKLGITLHVLRDEEIPHKDLMPSKTTGVDETGLKPTKSIYFGTVKERADPNHVNIIAAKQLLYHYALFAHKYPDPSTKDTSSGIAERPGMNFMVTLGAAGWGTDPPGCASCHNVGSLDQQEGTFMHELGHNLNLRHGGGDEINCKPNYLSVMNYARQFSSLINDRPLDYSRSKLGSLNEANLNENNGISASTPPSLMTVYGPPEPKFGVAGIPLDWNRNGVTTDKLVNEDIDKFADKDVGGCPASASEILNGYDDWHHLQLLKNGGIASPGSSQPIRELSIGDVRQHRILLMGGIHEAINQIPDSAFTNTQQSKGLKAKLLNDTNPDSGSISALLRSDQLDAAIAKLSGLKTQVIRIVPPNNNYLIFLIDNIIGTLEKQK
jgi:hypothetical protein